MTSVFTSEGVKKLNIAVGDNDILRGATWTRGPGTQILVPAVDIPVYIPEALIIRSVAVLTGDVAGSCVIDIWKQSIGSYPPTVANTITASAKPTISSGLTYSDGTLTGWTTSLAAGDTLMFHLDSSSLFRQISCFLIMERP